MVRAWIVFVGFALFYLLIVARLFHWQILSGDRLRAEAAAQHSIRFDLPALRGDIVTADGFPLVINQPAYLVFAEPPSIEAPSRFLSDIAKILPIDSVAVEASLAQEGRMWVPLARKVESSVVDELKKLNLAGLGFEKEPKRFYPEASMAAHLVGFVGSDNNGLDKGYFGLEGQYDRELRGKDGLMHVEKDVEGAPILVGSAKRIEPENGRKLVLWMDRTMQYIVEQQLKAGIERYGAKEGSVVVMDPKTGGILAMASIPVYNPGLYDSFDRAMYTNPIVGSSFEPGSTFKALVMSAGINEGVVTPSTTMKEEGPVQVGEYFIRTWNNQYGGDMTMTKVLERSSNVGMVFVGEKLGHEKLLQYIKDFGFGEITGIDLQDESAPALRAEDAWYEIDYATATFGQGIAVTPLQMVRAVGALANGGNLMEPHVVKEIVDDRGKTVSLPPKKIRQVISAQTAELIGEMLVQAVDNGEAKWAKPVGYRIAGKTGTAQIPVAGHYDAEKTIASFVGFAPVDDPKFVMLVTLREPTSSPWGSETAAPLFFTIAREFFRYLNIPPTTP